jgi:predicted phage terminase large subunit-like protein
VARPKVAPGKRRVVLPAARPYQWPVLASPARNKVLLCGRRWGKSKVALICALEGHGPRRGFWPGALQGARIGWFVPSHKHASARDTWADLKLAVGAAAVDVSEEGRRIGLPGGGSVQLLSGHDADAARGIYLDGAIVDECSLQAEALWAEGIRPTLSDYQGWALFCGTVPPEVHLHWFVRLYLAVVERLGARGWEAWRRPSAENPQLSAEDLEAARLELGTRVFLREYGAELLGAEGGVWREAWFRERFYLPGELPEGIRRVVLTLDAAWKTGVRNDYSAAQVWAKTATDYYLVDELHGRWESPLLRRRVAEFRARCLEVAEARGLALPVYVEDAGGGQVAVQEFRAAADFPVLPYAVKGSTKMARQEAVAPLAEAGKVWLPRPDRAPWVTAYLGELVGFPDLPHDDRCDATAMALQLLRGTIEPARAWLRPQEMRGVRRREPVGAVRERGGYA